MHTEGKLAEGEKTMEFRKENLVWTREPKDYQISDEEIRITTEPGTDLWQRTYYGFQNDNAPVLQMKTSEKYFFLFSKDSVSQQAPFRSVRHSAVSGQ